MSILTKVQAFISYSSNGEVNWEESMESLRAQLHLEVEEARENDRKFEEALDRLFDRVPHGTPIPTPIAVQTATAEVAGGDFSKLQELMPACESFVERSPRFQGKRGRNGGLFRVG
jgi:hypothetical protein